MAKILVVDDLAANRELVVSLINVRGHEPLEAADGAEALELVRKERPELIISDILMPTMDGYEFVRQLRADPAIADTEVIFYSAHYLEREARNLAMTCGVSRVLIKPCEPEDILDAIDQALGHAPPLALPIAAEAFDREHMQLMTDKLSANVAELEAANWRLAALTELNLQLASERDPRVLLETVCRSARDLIGAKYAVLCVKADSNDGSTMFTSGIEPSVASTLKCPDVDHGQLGETFAGRHSRRVANPGGDATFIGLPPGYPPLHAALIAPVISLTHSYGWICLADKLGTVAFSDEDQQILAILAAQVGRIYENSRLYLEVQQNAERLQTEVAGHKRTAQVLLESERRFADMLQNVELVSLMLDRDARITYCNDYLLRLTGWQREEVIGRNWLDIFIPADDAHMRDVFAKLIAEQSSAWHHENEILTRSGGRLFIRWSNTVLCSETGQVIGSASIGEDITMRKRVEDALRTSELQQRQLAVQLDIERSRLVAAQRVAKIGSWDMDLLTMSAIWSDETHRIFEADPANFQPTHDGILAIVHPDDRASINDAFMQSLGSGVADHCIQHRLLLPDGRIKFVEERWQVHFDQQNRPIRAIGTSQDITERRHAEDQIRDLNADLENRVQMRTAELEAANRELEAFDYSIAHDLRAPIRHIEGFGAMLMEDFGSQLDARGRDCVQRIQDAGSRMEQLVGDLLALSLISRCELNRTKIDLSALALMVFNDLESADPGRQIEFIVRPNLTVSADRGLLRNVLENLIGNARKFTARRSGATIEFGRVSEVGEAAFFVRDNGAGFDSAFVERLFAPFQRLHKQSEFKGTGIGLATVRRTITRHGGKVWAEGEVDQGATVYFTLPS